MVPPPEHTRWLYNTGRKITLIDGGEVELWHLQHEDDDTVLSMWATHFRNQYCLDSEIDFLLEGTGLTRSQYLDSIKFPDPRLAPGPSIRAGDFGEILVADYLEYIMNYWVPRTRYNNKTVRNESTKGSDLLGFHINNPPMDSLEDILTIFEVKAKFTGSDDARLQKAVDGSAKDQARKAESLNAIKQRFLDKQMIDDARRIQRFQNPEDKPFTENYGAVALINTPFVDNDIIKSTSVQKHPFPQKLTLLVIHGDRLMDLVHELYRRAANEA
ncbi:Hachiman antiphage defense system protein HamA [Paenibacillus sp. sgz5001063]|uniref:Hachiman antiphage defense system protein HamA n=1 Tax=Paenibacillus sp. sgz5001063 TaxID=3242474 RepID=UPI0036D229B0